VTQALGGTDALGMPIDRVAPSGNSTLLIGG
jgi:hypothetical protein